MGNKKISKDKKVAFITGITGQDGSYLVELLLEKNYSIHGLIRRNSSSDGTERIKKLQNYSSIKLHYGDITDFGSLASIIKEIMPDEIYNLASQSHVKVSYSNSLYTADANGMGTLRILEIIRLLGLENHTRFYQASTSEMYGEVQPIAQKENSEFHPISPYGVSKLYAHWITKNYRRNFNIFASTGILFNHESPRRGETFVTRKITKALAELKNGIKKSPLELGNIEAKRDWGHAKDYVKAMWLILQQENPNDFVISTGEVHSVREFIEIACKFIGFNIIWEGEGIDEIGIDANDGRVLIKINKDFYRPSEVDLLFGDSSLAKKKLGWRYEYSFKDLVEEMCLYDLKNSKKNN